MGFATISSFISYYSSLGVSLKQLTNWATCPDWSENIFHSLPRLPSGASCEIFSSSIREGLRGAQSMALTVLVSLEMLKALSAVSLDRSLIQIPPWKNKYLLCEYMISMNHPLMHRVFSGSSRALQPPFASHVLSISQRHIRHHTTFQESLEGQYSRVLTDMCLI